MSEKRQVKLFRNGRNQAVRIPREFELPGEDAIMTKEGDRIVIEPARDQRTLADMIEWLRTQPPLDEPFPEIEELPHTPVEI